MYKIVNQNLFLFFLLLFYICGFAQNSTLDVEDQKEIKYPDFYPVFELSDFEVNLLITDTVIVVKKSTNKNRYAAKVNVEFNISDMQDTIFLYLFNQYVPTKWFEFDSDPFNTFKYSIGLNYIVEDTDNNIMPTPFILSDSKVEIIGREKRNFVTSRQKIKFKELNKEKQRIYDLAKYEIVNETQNLVLYPLVGIHHFYLPKGEYYLYFIFYILYFIYSLTTSDRNMTNAESTDSRTFKGNFISNKVKLIVK